MHKVRSLAPWIAIVIQFGVLILLWNPLKKTWGSQREHIKKKTIKPSTNTKISLRKKAHSKTIATSMVDSINKLLSQEKQKKQITRRILAAHKTTNQKNKTLCLRRRQRYDIVIQ